jgi:phosphoglycolate phosphatase-like HAD superfamily hydrolase
MTNDQLATADDLRVILWDIDGTILRSTFVDTYAVYMKPVLLEVFGTFGKMAQFPVSGMTDLQIMYESIREEGFTAEQVMARDRELSAGLMEQMQLAAERGDISFYLLPGVAEALEATEKDPRYLNTLLTGNLEPAAHMKLKLVGVDRFFNLPGAFGDDSMDRLKLPAFAADRMSAHLGRPLTPSQFIVIGDTENDIACAKHFGARSIAVATGRSYTPEILAQYSPDAILPDLSNTQQVMATLGSF